MTWYYDETRDADGELVSVDVYDHTGSLVDTLGSGVKYPNDVLDVMYDEALAAYQDAGNSVDMYVLRCLADAAFEQIVEGTPP